MFDHRYAQIPVILLNRVQERFVLDGEENGSVPLCMWGKPFRDGTSGQTGSGGHFVIGCGRWRWGRESSVIASERGSVGGVNVAG